MTLFPIHTQRSLALAAPSAPARKGWGSLGTSRCLTRGVLVVLMLMLSPNLASPLLAQFRRMPTLGGNFQVAFVTRLESVSLSDDFTVLFKEGKAESLQASAPGAFIGTYREEVLLTDPQTDPANGLFKIRETLTTRFGALTWEAVVLIVATGKPFYGQIGWSRGTITAGTGVFAGATGTVDIAGRNNLCDPTSEDFCVPLLNDPTQGQRQDFNFILRGEIAID